MSSDSGFFVSDEILTKLGKGDIKAGRRTLRALIDLEMVHTPVNGPTPRPANVRAATEADEDGILTLLRQDFTENARHVAPFNEQCVRSFIYAATRERLATIGVIDGPGGIVGMIYFQPEQWWWADEWYISERLTFVSPDHRAGHNATDLLKFARWFCDEMSEKYGHRVYLLASVVATKDARQKTALFGRLMNFAGGIFCYPDPTPRQT